MASITGNSESIVRGVLNIPYLLSSLTRPIDLNSWAITQKKGKWFVGTAHAAFVTLKGKQEVAPLNVPRSRSTVEVEETFVGPVRLHGPASKQKPLN